MKIVFLLSHIPNPRINKRIAVAQKLAKVTVICIRRKTQELWQPLAEIEHIILDIDLPSSKHLLKRYWISRSYKKEFLRSLKEIEPDIIYTEGLDSLVIANKYRSLHPKVPIFFEVADLREYFIVKPDSFVKYINSRLVSCVEKKNFKGIDYLLLTSLKFYEYHYHKLIEADKVLYMPNIPDLEVFSSYEKKNSGKFTVGFIGGIRYFKQMKMLVDAAEQVDCQVLFAGAGMTLDDYEQITEYCKSKSFVSFTGRYDYNKDIAKLYGKVDCVYAVYDADNPNVRIALPNKLYEAIYCGLPIIVAKETYLAELVQEWQVGIEVSHTNISELKAALKQLATDKECYSNLVKACYAHKDEICIKKYNAKLQDELSKCLNLG